VYDLFFETVDSIITTPLILFCFKDGVKFERPVSLLASALRIVCTQRLCVLRLWVFFDLAELVFIITGNSAKTKATMNLHHVSTKCHSVCQSYASKLLPRVMYSCILPGYIRR